MATVDTSKVEIRKVNNTMMNGLFAKQDIAAGEVVFIENIIVFENANRKNPGNVPDVVALALRIWADNHVDELSKLGFKSSIWTQAPPKEHKKIINRFLSNGGWNGSKDLALDCYGIAAGYNIQSQYSITDYPEPGSEMVTTRRLISYHSCMINHSCDPNSTGYPVANAEELAQRINGVIALSDIRAGDEITFSYMANLPDDMAAAIKDPNRRRAAQPLKNFTAKQRRTYLKKHYGFNCACPRCRSPLMT